MLPGPMQTLTSPRFQLVLLGVTLQEQHAELTFGVDWARTNPGFATCSARAYKVVCNSCRLHLVSFL